MNILLSLIVIIYLDTVIISSTSIVWHSSPGDVCVYTGETANLSWSYTTSNKEVIRASSFFYGTNNPRKLIYVKPSNGNGGPQEPYSDRTQFFGNQTSPGILLSEITSSDEGTYSITLSGLDGIENKTNTHCQIKVIEGEEPVIYFNKHQINSSTIIVTTNTSGYIDIVYKHNLPANISLSTTGYTQKHKLCAAPCRFSGLLWHGNSVINITMNYSNHCKRTIQKLVSIENGPSTSKSIPTTPDTGASQTKPPGIIIFVCFLIILTITIVVVAFFVKKKKLYSCSSKREKNNDTAEKHSESDISSKREKNNDTAKKDNDSDISDIDPNDDTLPENKSLHNYTKLDISDDDTRDQTKTNDKIEEEKRLIPGSN